MERLSTHGGGTPRGLEHVPRSPLDRGRYGRMFRSLPALSSTDAELRALADSMGDAEPVTDRPDAGDNPELPAGYTYLAQFVDHDITFDPVSALERGNDPDGLENFRTPRFDLDCVYGRGPLDSPYLYDQDDTAKLLVGRNTDTAFETDDLPRNQQGRALIGDPRNDVHAVISQLHLVFIRFHNAAVDLLRTRFVPVDQLFDEARRLVGWHYQWVVVHDLVRRLVGAEVLGQALAAAAGNDVRRLYSWRRHPFMPVEFSAAAYRFGHSMVRPTYRLNAQLQPLPILTPVRHPHPVQHLGGFRALPRTWTVDWSFFFDVDGSSPQLARRIDTRLCQPLLQLPAKMDPARRSLALLNLMRGRALGLPSGQAVAAAVGTRTSDSELGVSRETPLWFYLLRESEIVARGLRLGPTGARIVADVLIGLLQGDPSSFLRMAPAWEPELPGHRRGQFTMVDLLRVARVVP